MRGEHLRFYLCSLNFYSCLFMFLEILRPTLLFHTKDNNDLSCFFFSFLLAMAHTHMDNLTNRCVTKLCDPKMTTQIEIPDLMICAPWTADVFTCLADGKDHTPCCRERGIPSPCDDLCSGNITRLDYHYFKLVI